eukprot:4387677-Prymnesium_polylepis.1
MPVREAAFVLFKPVRLHESHARRQVVPVLHDKLKIDATLKGTVRAEAWGCLLYTSDAADDM